MTEAVIAKSAEKPRGRPLTYATKEIKAAVFKERQAKAGLVLAWVPKALVAAYRAERDAGVAK
ncbi:hypothetical protein [Rhodoferax ferrireducens]|uniref:hypothetical protein n=1 Tax=Rhodoferax ferrireducens TaxID=192843 RepID=UPI00140F9D8C|nr:hypothetical protein [Rhodoferax ferrireducens]